jgi:hypothetical protein
MFILGLLAFLQTVFIPGFIVIKYLGINLNADAGIKRTNKIRQLVYAFGLSLLINYLLVFIFTALGIYKPLTLYVLLCIEGVLLIYYWTTGNKPQFDRYINLDISRWVNSLKQFFASHSLAYNFLFLVSVGVILWYVFLFFYFLDGVFQHWDPVTGWNRFALDWAGNQFPANTWRYPQLVPANWSISYVMMQNTGVQCFAKTIMPLFSIAVLLLFLDLALGKKKAVYLLGLTGYGILLGYIYDPSYIVSGYVDIAASFFAFLSFHVMYNPGQSHGTRGFQVIWLAVIFASGAAVTKQAGLFILGIILVWGFRGVGDPSPFTVSQMSFFRSFISKTCFFCKRLQHINKKEVGNPPPFITRKVLLLLLTVIIIAASWYIVKEVQIAEGLDRSEIAMVQGVHQSNSYTERLANAFDHLATHRHPKLKPLVWAGILLIFLGLFHKKSRSVTLFIVIPYSLMWGFFFSYDTRNLALSIPFAAFSAAFGLAFLNRLFKRWAKIPHRKIPLVPVIIAVLLLFTVLNFTFLKTGTLIQHQTRLRMKTGNARLNELLYQYHEKEGIRGKIATNYPYLQYLPGLGQFYQAHNTRINMKFLDYLETEKGEDIHYFLMPMIFKSEKAVYKEFQRKLKTNEYRMIFKLRTYWFVQVKREEGEKLKSKN